MFPTVIHGKWHLHSLVALPDKCKRIDWLAVRKRISILPHYQILAIAFSSCHCFRPIVYAGRHWWHLQSSPHRPNEFVHLNEGNKSEQVINRMELIYSYQNWELWHRQQKNRKCAWYRRCFVSAQEIFLFDLSHRAVPSQVFCLKRTTQLVRFGYAYTERICWRVHKQQCTVPNKPAPRRAPSLCY